MELLKIDVETFMVICRKSLTVHIDICGNNLQSVATMLGNVDDDPYIIGLRGLRQFRARVFVVEDGGEEERERRRRRVVTLGVSTFIISTVVKTWLFFFCF